MSRRAARRHVFSLIFQLEFVKNGDKDALFESYLENHAEKLPDSKFIYEGFSGVYQNLEKIDKIISENLKAWTTDRLNKADFAILRLGVYEMIYNDEIPASVAINEAVELAKTFCEDDSPGFVNAILGDIIKSLNGEKPC
ncbi:MAG: transcription antitermination factor NusB [Defluviitaleaceae bacterium]|nr:transcription antitermination factor NusB [Defluviitaleaceae bacterium]